ncbi:fatty acid transporter protein [Podospora aff. communis PSN243]|uniref:Fatty acid transporter protein n=1 Tax=Podospora aff. communis PSN243 TaxID=3040156 RepID=A0AAV9GF47_9PEZI|nr:fatty acid transporter protein [Podospora aff. communis PSN243]
MTSLAPLALTAAAAAATSAYLRARLSLDHDLLFLRITTTTALNLLRAVRTNRLNIFYVLESRALDPATASKPFLWFEGRVRTYAQVYDSVLRCGNYLRTNGDGFVVVWFALWSIGATPAFLNWQLRGEVLGYALRASGARFLVVDGTVEGEMEAMERVRFGDEVRAVGRYVDLAVLIYTSGTTGMPKPAVMAAKGTEMTKEDVMYLGQSMPLYHSSASCIGVCSALWTGATAAIGRKFSTKNFWPEIRASNATAFLYVGETCRYLTVTPPEIDPVTGANLDKAHKIRVVMGNGLRPDVWNRFKDRFGIDTIFEFYASTEGPIGSWNRSRNDLSKGAIGRYGLFSRAFFEMRSTIVALDHETDQPWRDPKTGFGRRAKSGENGELIVALPPDDIESRFQGYFNNKGATNSKIIRDVFKKGDAWFRTGDVMRWKGVGDGCLYFNDRIGDTYRWKSENVSTAEVAEIVGAHPSVLEANVYGVQLPNHDGRAGCVAIALDQAQPNGELLASLAKHSVKGLPKYAVPLFLRVVKDVGLQKTGTNKQQKNVLRDEGVDPAKVASRSGTNWTGEL